MSEILIIGDLHFKHDNIEQCAQFVDQVKELLPRTSHVIILGDVLHYHERLHTSTLNRFFNFLKIINKPTIILVGNHDMINNQVFCDADGHWMNILKEWKNITIVDYPQYLKIENITFLAAPYVYPGRLAEAFELFGVKPNNADYCLLHQEIKGCKMGAIESSDGDEYTWSTPCFSGHVHDKQQVGNVLYVGSAFEHSFGSKKCFLILLNPKTKTIEHVPSKVVGKRTVHLSLLNCQVTIPTNMPNVEPSSTSGWSDNLALKLSLMKISLILSRMRMFRSKSCRINGSPRVGQGAALSQLKRDSRPSLMELCSVVGSTPSIVMAILTRLWIGRRDESKMVRI
jgi:flavodoxin